MPLPRFSLCAAAVLATAACGWSREPVQFQLRGTAMGSTWSVQIVDAGRVTGESDRQAMDREIRQLLERIDGLMSTWDPDSELSRFNRSASVERTAVAPETFDVFRHGIVLAVETSGAFDVTVGGLVEAWGFGPAAETAGPAPDAERMSALRSATGIAHLELDAGGRWVRKRRPDVRVDLSGVAPGYAADRVAGLLAQRGLADFLVDVGGEMVARGRNAAGRPWQVAVELPPDGAAGHTGLLDAVVPLTDAALATSGDYRNYREIDGTRATHIIDPRSGRPIDHRLASVTIVTDRAVRADALATAVMVLGPDEGMRLAERLELAALFLVRRDNGTYEQRRSPRMNVMLGGH